MDDRRDRLRALGELLRRLRKDAGLTGKDLASRAGVTQPTISQIETGQLLPLPETVERLVEALELSREARAELDALLTRLRDEVSRLKGGLAGRESANAARVRAAHRVASFQSAMIPALLQTAEYARLLSRSGGTSMKRPCPGPRLSASRCRASSSSQGGSSRSSSRRGPAT
ncbi:helix-turn-helix domain-containing protein [Nonomuraea sp. bgisy101]|uniref:helix-turn-helix domain-containing protein n=1 Tax=Nonomuraea sp. bgisy101 TaxID=3413784 RepID=UPI003D71D79A